VADCISVTVSYEKYYGDSSKLDSINISAFLKGRE